MGTKQTQLSFAARSWQLATDLMRGKNLAWFQKIGAAIADQALFAGSNFIINIFLPMWMKDVDYGAFAYAYSWFLLPQNVYEALIIEPLTIYGSKKFEHVFRKYLGFVYVQHALVSVIIALGLIGVALVGYWTNGMNQMAAGAVAGAAVCAPFLLTRWLTRQPFYIQSRPLGAAIGSFIYFVLALIFLFALKIEVFGFIGLTLTPATALLAMGFAGAISSAALTFIFLKPDFQIHDGSLHTQEAVRDHISYARWAVPSRLLNWIPPNYPYILLPAYMTLAESGALKVLTNLVQPVYMTMVAVTAVLLPSFVRIFSAHGRPGLSRRLRRAIPLSLLFTGGYCLLLVLFGDDVIRLLFPPEYSQALGTSNLLTLGLAQIVLGCMLLTDAALRASGGIKKSFLSNIAPALFMLTVGSVLIKAGGIFGANLATLLTVSISFAGTAYLYITDHRVPPTNPERDPEEDVTQATRQIATQEYQID